MKTNQRTLYRLSVLVAAFSAIAFTGQAAGFSDDFESYAAGSNMHGQGGWKGWDNSAAAGAQVSTAQAFSGTKSVSITGASDFVHEFSGVTSGIWEFSVQQYIPSSSMTGLDSYLILLNKYKDGGASTYDNWSVQTHAVGSTGKFTVDMGSGTANIVKDQWVEFRFEINLDANTVTEYYNNAVLSTHAWQSGGANTLEAVDLFANSTGPVYYDNVSVSAKPIPEPSTFALFGLGAAALLWRRKSR